MCRRGILLAAVVLLGLVPPVRAGDIAGVSFPDQIETRGGPLELRGVGRLRWRALVTVCAAAFYRASGEAWDRTAGAGARRVEITYLHDLRAADLAHSAEDLLRRNVARGTFEAIRSRVARLQGLFRDVRPGDRFAVTYLPGAGTEVALNGEPLAVIDGDDFGDAVFAIWFGPRPLDRELKAQLLGAV